MSVLPFAFVAFVDCVSYDIRVLQLMVGVRVQLALNPFV